MLLLDGAGKICGRIAGVQEISIGRSRRCNVVLPLSCATVSQLHARISMSSSGCEIEDFSSNGTHLNGEWFRKESRTLNEGDEIIFGTDPLCDQTRVKVSLSQDAPIHKAESESSKVQKSMNRRSSTGEFQDGALTIKHRRRSSLSCRLLLDVPFASLDLTGDSSDFAGSSSLQ
eukprot:428428-Rhodomonas_salina.1